jgi:uncharacterized protein (TIGR02466 family)
MHNKHLKFIFPQSLYIVDNLMVNKLKDFEENIKKIADEKGTNSCEFLTVKSSFSIYDKMYNDENFKELAIEIKKHCLNYLKELGLDYMSDDLNYVQMWFNISHQGDFNIPHVHGNSIISGAYYVKGSKEHQITFFKNISNMMPPAVPDVELGKAIETIDCIPGRLILFKSDLMHGNGSQKDGEKIVISFNLGNAKLTDLCN